MLQCTQIAKEAFPHGQCAPMKQKQREMSGREPLPRPPVVTILQYLSSSFV